MKKNSIRAVFAFLLLAVLALAESSLAATVVFPPPRTAVTDKFAAIAATSTPNAVINWQHHRSAGMVMGQSQSNGEGLFSIPVELEKGINRITFEGTLVEIFYDGGDGIIPQGFMKRRAHAGDLSACTDCHDKFTNKLLEGGYPAVCLSCHVVMSQNEENPKDPNTDSHFKSAVSQCSSCHEPHYSQSVKLLNQNRAKRPCGGCHQDKYASEQTHKAFEEGGCSACHDAHFSGFPHNLHQYMPGVCGECHSQGSNINPKTMHPPGSAPADVCTKCHNPHGTSAKLLLKSVKSTCTSCHQKILFGGHKDELAECGKCHDPHLQLGSGLLRKDFPAGCESCHDDVRKGKTVHKPAQKGCSACHAPHSDDNRQKALKLCLDCHNFKTGSDTSKLHGQLPLQVKDCKLCHEPHSSEQPFLLKKKTHFPLTQGKCDACHGAPGASSLKIQKVADKCDKCHSTVRDLAAKGAKIHDPVAEGDCSACHDPHMSAQKAYLRSPMQKVCGECHDKLAPKEGLTQHPAIADCSDCHGVHGGENKKFLASTPPKLCIGCHDDPTKGKKMVHGALEEGCTACHDPHQGYGKAFLKKKDSAICLDCHKNPAENKKVAHPAMDEGCTSCHNPHASDAKKLLKTAGNKLCLGCHSDPAAGGAPHPALDEGCTACHKPHGTDTKKLLADKPEKLCLGCHDDPTKNKKVVHPAMDEGCTACHNGHVSKSGKLLKRSVNEVCADCHADMKKHHVLDASAASSYPKAKGTFPVVGDKLSCVGCHTPHASDEKKLYARPESDICSSCH